METTAMKTEREKQLDQIYRAMHRDYKGKIDGVRTVMVLRAGGSCLIALDSMTDEEIARHLPKGK
jgi:hypothetical protein